MKFCICGAPIQWQELPPKLAEQLNATEKGFWKHSDGGDIYCYPDDPTTAANPALATLESTEGEGE